MGSLPPAKTGPAGNQEELGLLWISAGCSHRNCLVSLRKRNRKPPACCLHGSTVHASVHKREMYQHAVSRKLHIPPKMHVFLSLADPAIWQGLAAGSSNLARSGSRQTSPPATPTPAEMRIDMPATLAMIDSALPFMDARGQLLLRTRGILVYTHVLCSCSAAATRRLRARVWFLASII